MGLGNILSEMSFGGSVAVVILGIFLVFLVLLLLVYVVKGFKALESKLSVLQIGAKAKKEALNAAEERKILAPAQERALLTQGEGAVDPSVIAAITAAVALMSEERFGVNSKSKFVVRDIRKLV
ncbi:MAG: OadG family protein [Clostridiales bacterium]|jgi:sodium pump decarboxylase gamma subunit|nr:OadG family protein [Clostridiales bacterium]